MLLRDHSTSHAILVEVLPKEVVEATGNSQEDLVMLVVVVEPTSSSSRHPRGWSVVRVARVVLKVSVRRQ